MTSTERFMNYIQLDTTSDESSPSCPSTEKQKVLGARLAGEMTALGVQDAHMDAHGYVYGFIPANAEDQPAIGLIAHMDTVDCVPALPMKARVVKDYDGGPIELECGDVLDPGLFPAVKQAKGKNMIVTDGRTLLGADDKAGVAEIMTACETILSHPELKHGKICIGFTPDEEIGRGADLFDVQGFGADYAYTVDGGEIGGIEYECFNAANAKVTVTGISVHPGSAKDIMKNAGAMACEFQNMLPAAETPEHTCGYEGFYHLCDIRGDIEKAEMTYIIRDHDHDKFEARKARMEATCAYLNGVYGEGSFVLDMKDSYYNMGTLLVDRMDIVRRAEEAFRACGVAPFAEPIRGGTDGARLTYMGLPCPNLSTGGMNGHGRFECCAVQDLEKMAEVLVKLVTI